MNGEKGFTYPAALVMILIVSSSLMGAQKYWSTITKRETEKELLFRGHQIYRAIESYYNNSPGSSRTYPKSFDSLLKDKRYPVKKRHLRKNYLDPVTKDAWGIIYDGKSGIKGVYSKSIREPLKKANFKKEFISFENKRRYSDWKFLYEPKK
ncbi:MAG: type II secretion system protein [Desulfobacter sp.]|nr:MAG: type II secretion system protein [Desulfobacter sp.]